MRTLSIGLMLFAFFFGAANLILPPFLGQQAGDHFWLAALGFVSTGVMLPAFGVIALGFSGEKDFLKLSQRGGLRFGLIFTTVLYLTIGPLFAMPRTGSTSYRMLIHPFLESDSTWALALFTIVYFSINYLVASRPTHVLDVVGKILTPLMLFFITILILLAVLSPMGEPQIALDPAYETAPFFTGFVNGYLTMDTLASFVFGIIVIYTIMNHGVRNKAQILLMCIKASLIAGTILATVYISLTYLGATSISLFGPLDDGALILTHASKYYLGVWGNILLGTIVTLACLTTSIGLTTACANYAITIYRKISYRQYALMISITGALFANMGLAQLIEFSVPILIIIYPVTIVFTVLTFTHKLFQGHKSVYIGAIYTALLISLFDGLKAAGLTINWIENLFNLYLPFYSIHIGWLVPAVIGAIIGYIYSIINKKNENV